MRLAILPANVLIENPSSEWLSLGVAVALEQDLVTSRQYAAALATSESGAYQRGATHVLRATIENRNGRLTLSATVTDLATQRVRHAATIAGPSGAGALTPINALAKRIDPQATDFSTASDTAWAAYTEAASSSDPRTREHMLQTAIGDDPSFGLAYLVLAELEGQQGNAAQVIAEAAKHRDSFTPLDQARFKAIESRTLHAPLPQQAAATEAVLKLAPNDLEAMTTLGSMRFLEGDAQDGERLMKRALQLNPDNATTRDQLAEGLLETRRFAEADKLFTQLAGNRAVQPQLAISVLLAGDLARANSVFSDYLKERAANDPLLFLSEANWIAVSKRPSDAVEFLAKNKFSQNDLRSLALSESAIWRLMGKDSAGARGDAANSAQLAQAPVPKLFAAVAMLVSAADADPTQWRAQVNAAPLPDSIKRAVLAYGFFLNGRFAEAVPEWQNLVVQSGDADLRARAMLAASLDRAGRSADARKIRVQPFAPNLTGADQFAVVTFDEMRRLLNLGVH